MKIKRILCSVMSVAIAIGFAVSASATDENPAATVTSANETKAFYTIDKGWAYAVNSAKTNKDVVFKLGEDWIASSGGTFGSGTGFRNGAICYSNGNNITIDLNGYTVDRGLISPVENGAVIYVDSNLTIIDSNPKSGKADDIVKGGIITGGASTENGGGIVLGEKAKLNFNGGTILNCVSTESGGAVFLESPDASLIVNGGSFYGNRYSSAVYCNEGKVTINNSVFEGNYSQNHGGAICINDGKLNIKNTAFYSNSSADDGGAIFVDGNTKTNIESCLFAHNKSNDNGGAVYIDSGEGTYLYDTKMYYNVSSTSGGAVYINDDKAFVIGGEYKFNTANDFGGGIYVDSMHDINVAGKLIVSDNTVNKKQSDLCIQSGSFSTAYMYCGGLYQGSDIWLCSTDSSSRLAISGIEKYQYSNYIHFDEGFKLDKIEQHNLSSNGIRAEGSALGSGKISSVLKLSAVVAVFVVIMIVLAVIKKKKGAEAGVKNIEIQEEA